MSGPLIGLTTRSVLAGHINSIPVLHDHWIRGQFAAYASRLAASGGVPVQVVRESDPVALAARLDGLLLTGGDDIDPRLRGSVPGLRSTPIEPAEDDFEMRPWNAPAAVGVGKIANALAVGCPVVIKPSEWGPSSVDLVVDAVEEAELPDGVVQLVHGAGDVGAQLVGDQRVAVVSFTGSQAPTWPRPPGRWLPAW